MNSPTYTPLPRPPAATEFIAKSIRAYGPDCIGCLTHGKDVMISFAREGDPVVYDLFLTRGQVIKLTTSLLDLVVQPTE